MTKEQVDKIELEEGLKPEIIETHISWLLLESQFVFKIKKPIAYSFLDFSTIERRKHFCERELWLNKRLTQNIYLDVQPVQEDAGRLSIGDGGGEVVDYAVKMRKVDRNKQMDILLLNDQVTADNIRELAKKIAVFHTSTNLVTTKNFDSFRKEFNDLGNEKAYLAEYLPSSALNIIDDAIRVSDWFMQKNKNLLQERLKKGFFRDCHGDLHSRNVFFLPDPQPFDCIEFNDEFRQIDILNEVAFLCMDLDAFERHDLSELFLTHYNSLLPVLDTKDEFSLFVYYKLYRANVRAKVNSLRAHSAGSDGSREKALAQTRKYLRLMSHYVKVLAA